MDFSEYHGDGLSNAVKKVGLQEADFSSYELSNKRGQVTCPGTLGKDCLIIGAHSG